MEEILLNSIKKALNELIISFFNKEITDDDVLKALNKSIHYNKTYSPYIYEMFYIQALELDKVPKNQFILLGLFSINYEEDRLIRDNDKDTRICTLKKLNMENTLNIYENFLISQDDEAHVNFSKKSIEREEKSQEKSMEDVRNSIINHFKKEK